MQTLAKPRTTWSQEAVFYHLYPLGCLGAPARNDFRSSPTPRLRELLGWVEGLADLGINALYLGPVFESTAHGYDTADYRRIDRRLGTAEDLQALSQALHARGIRLVLDGVFNHVGRDFWAFRDVCRQGQASPYRDWFHLDFSRRSPAGDRFWYEGWSGHYDLVKLNTSHPDVRSYLLESVTAWIEAFDLDGLRLDAADVLALDFQAALAAHCRALKPDFWLMGEVVHGDYRRWTEQGCLDGVTNYELYKGLYSSHNDRNYFELAHSLDRQFGTPGIYRGLDMYTFVDNHDVNRIASTLRESSHLYPLHILLFTVPGIPSLYYGSETGLQGCKAKHSDAPLRPRLTPESRGAHPQLREAIAALAALRQRHPALRRGEYQRLHVAPQQFAFMRRSAEETILVAVNASTERTTLSLPVSRNYQVLDTLNGQIFQAVGGRLELPLDPCWGRVLQLHPTP